MPTMNVETLLATLQTLSDAAQAAADQHARRFPTSPEDAAQDAWQAATLTELARQLHQLHTRAYAEIEP